MAEEISWRFYGYMTPAGGREVQDWYDGLSDEEKDEARDALSYLHKMPNHLWVGPRFKSIGDSISEVRFKVNVLHQQGTYRIYGAFWPVGQRYSYTFLLGKDKKVKNDRRGKREAIKRLRLLEQGRASVHDFEF
jgi:hypothetical protein